MKSCITAKRRVMYVSPIFCHCSGLNFILSEENPVMNFSMSNSGMAVVDFSV